MSTMNWSLKPYYQKLTKPSDRSWWAWNNDGTPTSREGFTARAMGEVPRMALGHFGQTVLRAPKDNVADENDRRAKTVDAMTLWRQQQELLRPVLCNPTLAVFKPEEEVE